MKSLFEKLSDAVNTDEDRIGLIASLLDRSVTETADVGYVIKATDRVVLAKSDGGAIAAVLPKVEDVPGQEFTVKRDGANAVTVEADAVDTDGVDGGGAHALAADKDSATFVPHNKGWLLV